MNEIRRVDIQWGGDEVGTYDALAAEAEQKDISIAALIKQKLQG